MLKAAGVYGANNAGKTCLVKCIRSIKEILLNGKVLAMPNIFSNSPVCELGITFLFEGNEYSYDFKYDAEKEEYIYERFSQIFKDRYSNERVEVWLLKDVLKQEYMCLDESLNSLIPALANGSLFIYLIETKQFSKMNEMKRILVSFAEKIDIINMNNIPIQKTIDILKNPNETQKKVVDFIKNADLYLEDYSYRKMNQIEVKLQDGAEGPEEKVLDIPEKLFDQICLVSVYKDVAVPSMIFDSTGTKKIASLASYIIEGLEQGRILVIDELDSSIHFKLTRAIVTMFNNERNINAQMIFTVHDINLMDCKRLFRKEQIWFVHKDHTGVYLYSLADFTAEEGVRDTSDIMEKYRKGVLGALPDPDLIESLLAINGDVNEVTDEE